MNKRKLLTLALSVCMIAILAIGGTLAYYMDTDDLTNTFTAGKVEILLDEAIVAKDANGDYVQSKDEQGNTRTSEKQTYDLHPGQTVLKDPTIHVLKDTDENNPESLPAYVAAKITVTGKGLDTLLANYPPYLNITKTGKENKQFVAGGLAVTGATWYAEWNGLKEVHIDDKCVTYQVPNATDGVWVIYLFVKAPVDPGKSVKLFESINIPAEYGNDEMAILNGMEIKVEAFAVQTESFDDNGAEGVEANDGKGCFDAMKAAFPEDFAF